MDDNLAIGDLRARGEAAEAARDRLRREVNDVMQTMDQIAARSPKLASTLRPLIKRLRAAFKDGEDRQP